MRHPYYHVVYLLLLAVPVAAQMEPHEHGMHAVEQVAAPMNHEMSHDMSGNVPRVETALPALAAVPASGRARESGMDGRHVLEATGEGVRSEERCALAARGIVMLDNATWAACGGKVQGVPPTPPGLDTMTSQQHMAH